MTPPDETLPGPSRPPPQPGAKPPPGPPERGRDLTRAIRNAALIAVLLLFLWITLEVDLVIFAGLLLAVCLRRAADRVTRVTGLPKGWALAVVVVLILVFFAAVGWAFSESIAGQINQLSRQLPAAIDKIRSAIEQSNFGSTLLNYVSPASLFKPPTNALSGFFGVASNAVEVLAALVIIVFIGLYLAAESELYENGLLRLVPPARRARTAEILHEAGTAIWHWMLGRMFSMTTLGVLTALGLWVIGVPLPVALGFLAGLMTFVPYIGTIASAVPSLLMAAAINLHLAIYVVILYLGVHFIEGYILIPLVQRRAVHLPPALTLAAQVILGVVAGFLGLLLATPLVAAGIVLVRMIYVEDLLGDRGDGPALRS